MRLPLTQKTAQVLAILRKKLMTTFGIWCQKRKDIVFWLHIYNCDARFMSSFPFQPFPCFLLYFRLHSDKYFNYLARCECPAFYKSYSTSAILQELFYKCASRESSPSIYNVVISSRHIIWCDDTRS